MKLLFTMFLTFFVVEKATAGIYLLGQGGYFNLRQQKAVDHKVTPTGTSYAGGIGFREKFYEVEALYLKAKAEDDIIHDSVKNKLVHEQSSLLFAFNFYLKDRFYLRVGYGFNQVDQKLKKPVSAASEAGAKDAYGMATNKVTEGPLFGAGFVILDGRSGTLFTQLEYMNFSSLNAGAWNASLGFRFYFGN